MTLADPWWESEWSEIGKIWAWTTRCGNMCHHVAPFLCPFGLGLNTYGDGSKPWYLVNPKIAGIYGCSSTKNGMYRYWSIAISHKTWWLFPPQKVYLFTAFSSTPTRVFLLNKHNAVPLAKESQTHILLNTEGPVNALYHNMPYII